MLVKSTPGKLMWKRNVAALPKCLFLSPSNRPSNKGGGNTRPAMASFLALKNHIRPEFGPRNIIKSPMWPADENSCPPLVQQLLLLCESHILNNNNNNVSHIYRHWTLSIYQICCHKCKFVITEQTMKWTWTKTK